MVQYALTNLYSTHVIAQSEFDERIFKQLRSLPEEVVLQSLQEFASTDFSNVRNKAAYLMGVIKKCSSSAGLSLVR
jgi:hypothetical protein